MRCVRFVGLDDQVHCGIVRQDETIEVVRGEFWGDYEATGEICQLGQIAAYLGPVDPPNIFAIGLNYLEHARETKAQLPDAPLIFIKATTSLNAHQGEIVLPRPAPAEVDFEAELVVVIGKKAKCVSADESADYIFGYTCGNDVTARDCQKKIDKQIKACFVQGVVASNAQAIGKLFQIPVKIIRGCIDTLDQILKPIVSPKYIMDKMRHDAGVILLLLQTGAATSGVFLGCAGIDWNHASQVGRLVAR